MHTAIILSRWPYPASGGRERMLLQHLEALIKRGSVTAFCVEEVGSVPPELASMRVVGLPRPSALEILRHIVWERYSFQEAAYSSRRGSQILENELIADHFDVIYVDMVRMAPLCRRISSLGKQHLRILDYDDRLSARYRDLMQLPEVNILGSRADDFPSWIAPTLNRFGKLILRIEAKLIQRSEKRWIKHFDKFVFSSPKESEDFMDEFGLTNVFAMPLASGARPTAASYAPGPIRLIFLGNLRTDQNKQSFLEIVQVYKERARVGLPLPVVHVFGTQDELDIDESLSDRFVFHGFVESLDVISEEPSILVAPIWMGSGIKTKVFDCFVRGVVVATSSRGVEGLNVSPDVDFIFGNTSEEIIDKAIEVCSDFDLFLSLRTASLNYTRRFHSQSVVDRSYDELLG